MNWFADLSDIVREDVPLAPFTWFKLGGPARWLVEPRSEAELSQSLRRCRDWGIEVRFLGKGANLLIDDGGIDAAVFRLVGPAFEAVSSSTATDQGTVSDGSRWWGGCSTPVHVTAFAGADLMALVKSTAREGLSGLHVLAGIPATVGGAIRMNCGGKYGEIAGSVRSVRVVAPSGAIRERSGAEGVKFRYRGNDLDNDRVVAATFELAPDDPQVVYREYDRIWREKMASQPSLGERSAGCIFKNAGIDRDGRAVGAGRLIDECGLKGLRVGRAAVSSRHANFIVAGDGATTADVMALIDLVRTRVALETGVQLETEVEMWVPEPAAA